MDELHEIIERIQIKYNPPRELFTIALPVAVALLVVLAAFLMGYTIRTTEKQTGRYHTSDKEESTAGIPCPDECRERQCHRGCASATPSAPAAAPTMGLDEVMVFALIIAILPYSIDITLQKRSTRKKEELYTEFLFKLSELMRGGLDPIKAVKELCQDRSWRPDPAYPRRIDIDDLREILRRGDEGYGQIAPFRSDYPVYHARRPGLVLRGSRWPT